MKLVIISGRSGSGKSTVLNVLEDAGYYCIDNLPAGLLAALVAETLSQESTEHEYLAVCIDARNTSRQLADFPGQLEKLPKDIERLILYLDADDDTLIARFSETRRRHPLSDSQTALAEALRREKQLLTSIADSADQTIDTRHMLFHELRDHIQQVVVGRGQRQMAVLVQSFGFKHGVPSNADLVFDLRCLPNPHWEAALRPLTGQDQGVIDFLSQQPLVQSMLEDIEHYLERWLPQFERNNRPYTTVALGCTGGRHRSVYMTEKLVLKLASKHQVQIRHRELPGS
ncbi:MAG: RNase adapter RapZ [Pseudomonadales bacterium]